METTSLQFHRLAAAGCGFLSHWLYFIHGEKDTKGLRIIIAYLNCQLLLAVYLFPWFGFSKTFWTFDASINLSYLVALTFSIVTYRLVFHRLRRFPGPFAAKITKGYGVWMSRNVKYVNEVCKLHDTYGDIVRIGKEMKCGFSLRVLNDALQGPMSFLLEMWRRYLLSMAPGASARKGSPTIH